MIRKSKREGWIGAPLFWVVPFSSTFISVFIFIKQAPLQFSFPIFLNSSCFLSFVAVPKSISWFWLLGAVWLFRKRLPWISLKFHSNHSWVLMDWIGCKLIQEISGHLYRGAFLMLKRLSTDFSGYSWIFSARKWIIFVQTMFLCQTEPWYLHLFFFLITNLGVLFLTSDRYLIF